VVNDHNLDNSLGQGRIEYFLLVIWLLLVISVLISILHSITCNFLRMLT